VNVEAARSSETLVSYCNITGCHNTEDVSLNNKSHWMDCRDLTSSTEIHHVQTGVYTSGITGHFPMIIQTLRAGRSGVRSRQWLGIFLFTTVSRQALGPTQSPIQWVPGALSLLVKRPVRETGHSPPSSAEVKNAWSYTSTPLITPSWRDAQLRKAQRQL
jgi:hypothetical protein